MIILDNKIIKCFRYYKPKKAKKLNDVNEVIQEARSKLLESMKIRMRSDVPIAFCLSGGVDSASLVSIACKELGVKTKTFSIIDKDLDTTNRIIYLLQLKIQDVIIK